MELKVGMSAVHTCTLEVVAVVAVAGQTHLVVILTLDYLTVLEIFENCVNVDFCHQTAIVNTSKIFGQNGAAWRQKKISMRNISI